MDPAIIEARNFDPAVKQTHKLIEVKLAPVLPSQGQHPFHFRLRTLTHGVPVISHPFVTFLQTGAQPRLNAQWSPSLICQTKEAYFL